MRQVELIRDTEGEFRFRVRADNGEIVAQGESYTRKSDAKEAAEREFPGAEVADLTDDG